jgi:hypothetical protein
MPHRTTHSPSPSYAPSDNYGTQGLTWSFGFFGFSRYFEQAALQHRQNYQTLTDNRTPRVPGYGLQTPESQP